MENQNDIRKQQKTAAIRPVDWPYWWNGRNIDEESFCGEFVRRHPLKTVGGYFFDVNGRIFQEDNLVKCVFDAISPLVRTNLAAKSRALVNALRHYCATDSLPVRTDRIHTANGTFFIPMPGMECFREEKEICCNRLPVNYNPDAPEPVKWKKFLSELLYEEDIPTLQEFIGYCLLPTTRGQKMLLIIGKGGEGKSRISVVLRQMLGANMNVGSIQKLENNRFSVADLEYRLLLLDDDMPMEALSSTNHLKTIVTAETDMDMEKKGQQSYQGRIYARLIGLGNGSLHALYDRSEGFFRRQIVLRAKDKAPEREPDPFLAEKMEAEIEGIFLWAIEGLRRLMANNYVFTISERAKENLKESQTAGNNITEFLTSSGYIRFRKGAESSSRELYANYKNWCEDNMDVPLSSRTFVGYLKEEAAELGLRYDYNVPLANGKRARGFRGIECARLGHFETVPEPEIPEPKIQEPEMPEEMLYGEPPRIPDEVLFAEIPPPVDYQYMGENI